MKRVRKELENYFNLITQGDAPASVLAEIKKRENRITELEAELAGYESSTPLLELDEKRLKKAMQERMGQFRALLREHVPGARQALRKLMSDAIRLTPAEDNTYGASDQFHGYATIRAGTETGQG
jgi:hypothetical protein